MCHYYDIITNDHNSIKYLSQKCIKNLLITVPSTGLAVQTIQSVQLLSLSLCCTNHPIGWTAIPVIQSTEPLSQSSNQLNRYPNHPISWTAIPIILSVEPLSQSSDQLNCYPNHPISWTAIPIIQSVELLVPIIQSVELLSKSSNQLNHYPNHSISWTAIPIIQSVPILPERLGR